MNASTVRLIHRVHRWSGITSALNLLVLALSGMLLIFHEEIDEALGVVPRTEAVATGTAATFASIVDDAVRRQPTLAVRYVSVDPDDPRAVFVTMQPPALHGLEANQLLTYDAGTGAYLAQLAPDGGITGWVLRLHTELLMGDFGKGYILLVGVAFFISLVTGILIYGPFGKRLGFGIVRTPRADRATGFWGRRPTMADLHRLLGPVTLMWNLAVAATGIMLALGAWLLPYYQRTELAALTASYANKPIVTHPIALDSTLAVARGAYPAARFTFAAFPGSDFAGPGNFLFLMSGTTPLESRMLKVALVDATTGALIAAPPMPWYLKWVLISEPLHFGDYGGLPLKIVWVLFALITVVLTASGAYVMLSRTFAAPGGASTGRGEEDLADLARGLESEDSHWRVSDEERSVGRVAVGRSR